MKKLMFVLGVLIVALNSPAIADVSRSSKGAAHCELNKADHLLKNTLATSVSKPKSEAAKQ